MYVEIEQRRRSKRQAFIAQDATQRTLDDQAVIAPPNVLVAEQQNELEIEGLAYIL